MNKVSSIQGWQIHGWGKTKAEISERQTLWVSQPSVLNTASRRAPTHELVNTCRQVGWKRHPSTQQLGRAVTSLLDKALPLSHCSNIHFQFTEMAKFSHIHNFYSNKGSKRMKGFTFALVDNVSLKSSAFKTTE